MRHEYSITIECTCGYKASIKDELEGSGGPYGIGDIGHRVIGPREGILGSIGLEDEDVVTITHSCSCGFTATTINACPGKSSIAHLTKRLPTDLSLYTTPCEHAGDEERCESRQPSTEGKMCFFQVPKSDDEGFVCGNRFYGTICGWWLDDTPPPICPKCGDEMVEEGDISVCQCGYEEEIQ